MSIKTTKTFKVDHNAIKNVEDFLKANYKVKIGVLAGANHEGGIGAVELASIHEFGSQKRHIPQRSFLRQTMVNYKESFTQSISLNSQKIMESIARGSGLTFMQKIGAQWVSYVMETFAAQGPNWAPLADSTIIGRKNFAKEAKKKKNAGMTLEQLISKTRENTKILQDTGEMKKSISFEVVQ